ncbi:MAG: hypothetical protein P8P83_04545 [Rickettsiaceae bacterium]|nr:hypothetical protein [Rickettsiaceae bacterium]
MKTCENLQEFLNFSEEERAEITVLDLHGHYIGGEGAEALAEALKENSTLTSLVLVHNNIGTEGAEAFAEALKKNSTLTELNLGYNNIGAEGAEALAEALQTNSTLASLNLDGNNISTESAAALAAALRENSTLISLDLLHNNLGPEGAVLLAKALKTNNTLTNLVLVSNNIGDKGTALLAEALKKNSTLTKFNLGNNNIGTEGAKALAEALKINNTLTSLSLYSNKIGDEGAALLAEAIKTNKTLTSLNLRCKNIGTEGAEALAEALKINNTLTELLLYNNKIDDEELEVHLKELIDRNKLIKDAVLYSLKKIAANDDVVDIDITKIPNIQHIDSIKNPIINPLDRYLDNEELFKEKLQESSLGLNIEILDAKADIHKASQLLKTEETFKPIDIPAPEEMITRKVKALTDDVATVEASPLHKNDLLGNIGSYLTPKDAGALKVTSRAPKKASENPSDGSGGGGATREEANVAEKNKISEQARFNQKDADVDAAISNSLQDMAFDNAGAAEEPGNGEESKMTGEVAAEDCFN